ncbi:hypothetical protein [Macrococcus animalis]|uniref:hypothetical protein n=1 Tax=Macrococcus animalis TaxID=3395467 RepID=UPI0039BEB959
MEPVMKIDYKATYDKYKDIAVVDYMTFYARLKQKSRGFTIERALTTETHSFKEWREIAIKNGISRATYYRRIKKGWNSQDAATTPIEEKYKKNKYVDEDFNMEHEIKLLLQAGVPIRKKKYVDYIKNNKDLFEGMI